MLRTFAEEDFAAIDRSYFDIAKKSSFHMVLRSKTTGYEYNLVTHEPGPNPRVRIQFRGRHSDPWRDLWDWNLLDHAMQSILQYDKCIYEVMQNNRAE